MLLNNLKHFRPLAHVFIGLFAIVFIKHCYQLSLSFWHVLVPVRCGRHTLLIIDVIEGNGGSFSLEGLQGKAFFTHCRASVFHAPAARADDHTLCVEFDD